MGYTSKFKGSEIDALLEQVQKGGTGSGSGVPIVDSVDKLDTDAPVGSLAVVTTQGSMQELRFRDLYQPTADIMDTDTGGIATPELLSSVPEVKIMAPEGSINGVNTSVYLVLRTLSTQNQNIIVLFVSCSSGVVNSVGADIIMGDFNRLTLITYTNGVATISQEAIDTLNSTLTTDDWCYFGSPESGFVYTEEQLNTLDVFFTVLSGIPSTADIFKKTDKWEGAFAGYSKEINNLKNTVQGLDASKADIVQIKDLGSYTSSLRPNEYNRKTNNSTGTLYFTLDSPSDTTAYCEYILEINCVSAPSEIVFRNEDGTTASIVWANGVPPALTSGMTWVISISGGLGVYCMFPNS